MHVILQEYPDKDPGWLMFFCPGCKMVHSVFVSLPLSGCHRPTWEWNASFVTPTFSPSVLTKLDHNKVCHLFITDGQILFLPDCWHSLAGQRVPLPPVKDWDDERFNDLVVTGGT